MKRFTISGRLVDAAGKGVNSPGAGVSLEVNGQGGQGTSTDSNGNWTFQVVAGLNYKVTPWWANHTFTPANQTFTNLSANQTVDFVVSPYRTSYLKRDAEQEGYDFWLNVLNNREPNNYRGMVCSFVTSAEYQLRFGSVATRTNADCGTP